MQPFYENHTQLFHCFYFNMESFPAHLHREIEIVYVEAGGMRVQADGQEFRLTDGDAMVLLPNVIHSYQVEYASRVLMTVFDHSLVAHPFGNLLSCSCERPYVRREQLHCEVPEYMKKLLHLDGGQAPSYCVIGYHVLVLGHILSEIPLKEGKRTYSDNHIQKILSFAAQHFREPLSIEDVGSEAGLSKYYVSRIFNQKIHCSFTGYINALRLNYAADRLLTTGETVESIALSSGFDSERSFYRNFQRFYHTTPSEYRRTYHREEEFAGISETF